VAVLVRAVLESWESTQRSHLLVHSATGLESLADKDDAVSKETTFKTVAGVRVS